MSNNGWNYSIRLQNSASPSPFTIQNKTMSVTGFYSDDGQKILAADFNRNFAGRKNLTVDYATVKKDDSFCPLCQSHQ
jgi:hypothetical protein